MNFCPFIDTTLIFTEDCITPCYTNFADKTPYYLKANLKKQKIPNFSKEKESFYKIINSLRINSYSCKNCVHLVTEETKFKKYNHIIISLWQNKAFKYDFFAIIKDIYKLGMLDIENLIVEIQSGNFAEISELNKILAIFKAIGYKEIHFMMNNVIYHPCIENILKEGKCSLCIIPNLRNNELEGREATIKNVLRRYMNAAKNKNSISVYFELIRGISDNEVAVSDFVKMMYTCGLNKIALRLDNNDINKWLKGTIPLQDCPSYFSTLILLFFKLCRRYSFYLDMSYTEQNIVFKKIFKSNKK